LFVLLAFFLNPERIAVMNLLHLEHIVETILSDVPCPHCGHSFCEDVFDIRNIRARQVDIFIPCKNCGSPVLICANIEEKIPETMFKLHIPKGVSKDSVTTDFESTISQEGIQKISQSLKNFKERDVRKLF
jgi:DNA-directed RNA polymerase subunit RPC12/RpoP